jgi:hypothetical protein
MTWGAWKRVVPKMTTTVESDWFGVWRSELVVGVLLPSLNLYSAQQNRKPGNPISIRKESERSYTSRQSHCLSSR